MGLLIHSVQKAQLTKTQLTQLYPEYKELLKCNNKNTKYLNTYFTKRDIQMINKHMKRYTIP